MIRPLRTRASFDWVAREGRRSNGRLCWLRYATASPTDTTSGPAVGYAIGRKVGPAVVRNRIRRRLRAIVRDVEQSAGLAPGYYLLGVRSSKAATAAFAELHADVAALVSSAPVSQSAVHPRSQH